MAGYLNKVQIIGNVGQDPDFRDVSTSQRVANFSIATTESWKDKATGEKKERTEWHRVTVWNDALVKVIEKYVKKGSRIYVEGALQTRKWKDKQDIERSTTEVVLSGFNGSLILLGDNGGGRGMSDPNQNASRPQAPQDPAQVGIDDEIPF
ncbi:single-stranded DNA-binding protein [Hyphomicrobium sp. 99]|uniref:single-stranded DNA-binding protein n=1 Tax=Hyphomicrobium sp. 99 TaxID=1163419 RepID=UPI0005F84A05|nr:single-stranded DNA-binding protein [Hyphomicrobium sp. 99]